MATHDYASLADLRTRALAGDDDALKEFLSRYPGPGGTSTYYRGHNHPHLALRQVAPGAREHLIVSGDVAADILAPWRNPTILHVYATAQFLAPPAWIPASEHDANVVVTAPADPSIAETAHDGVADRVHVAWELLQAGSRDRTQGAHVVLGLPHTCQAWVGFVRSTPER